MQVLAIERFIKETDATEYEKYSEQNKADLGLLYEQGLVTASWLRKDKPGNLILLDVESLVEAKKLLSSFELVENRIATYGVIALEAHQLEEFLPEVESKYTVLVYVSAETDPMSEDDLKSILEVSRKNNSAIDITGVLLYNKGSFMQVLEGKEHRINALYKKILKDSRHKRIAKVTTIKTDKKVFSEWSMGYASISEEDLESIDGLNDFFAEGNCFTDLGENEVKNILEAFKTGKWQQKIA